MGTKAKPVTEAQYRDAWYAPASPLSWRTETRLFHARLITYRIRNGHQTTTVTTTSHQSREMAVSLGPHGRAWNRASYCEINFRDAFDEPTSPLSRRNETHLFPRASLLKETLAFNLHLIYLDEWSRSWCPPVRTGNGLLHGPLHCGHFCNGLSEWSPLLTDQCL
jgi:hypothetical protein